LNDIDVASASAAAMDVTGGDEMISSPEAAHPSFDESR
jgi:hypothetical protein